jgi:hypothetical protein
MIIDPPPARRAQRFRVIGEQVLLAPEPFQAVGQVGGRAKRQALPP